MPFYDAGDAAIYYEDEGQGLPLVLLHGYALNGVMWDLQIPIFAKSFRVINVDLRGFGKSSCGNKWSGSVMAADVSGLIKSLSLENIAILGFSMGGPVAFRAALENPDLVSRLIMVSSILPSAGRPKAPKEIISQQKEIEILRSKGIIGWAESTGLWSGPLVNGMFDGNLDIRPLWEKLIARHNFDYLMNMMTARLSSAPSANWRSRLGEIKQETLIIMGESDSYFIDGCRILAESIPNSELKIISNAGHMLNLEALEQFNPIILNYIK